MTKIFGGKWSWSFFALFSKFLFFSLSQNLALFFVLGDKALGDGTKGKKSCQTFTFAWLKHSTLIYWVDGGTIFVPLTPFEIVVHVEFILEK